MDHLTVGGKAKKKYLNFNNFIQVGLITFTAIGFLLIAIKLPQYGLIANLISQGFWLYSAYKAWREADQIGIFIASICITLILTVGVINYWFLS